MDRKTDNIEHHNVIIVGAGISGFGAAARLLENDVTSFKIFEAEDRIGGRIYSVQFGDKYVDLGAEYVHGAEGNIIHQLAKDVLQECPNEMGWKLYYSNTDKNVDDLLVEFFTQIYELERNPGSPDISLCEAFTKRYETEILSKYKGDKEMEQIAKDFIKTAELIMLTIEGSFDWKDGRSKFHNFRLYPGNEVQPWSGLGYKEVFDAIKRKIGKEKARLLESRIHLKKTVTSIAIKDEDEKKIHVQCHDGTKYTADHLIFTASVGVLKHDHEKLFQPKLDDVKLKALQAIGIGGIFKVALEFTERWWTDEGEVYFIWSQEDEKKLFQDIPFGPTKGDEHWMSGFHCMSNTANEKVMTVWFAGHFVPEVEEMSDELLKKGIMYALNKFFGKTKNIPEPIHMIRSQWVTNPHFRGSFSYESMDIVTLKNSPQKELMEPITDKKGVPRIFFAGEALHPTRFSTADGALITGYTQADKIINCLNDSK